MKMKKIVAVLVCVLLAVTLALPAMAAANGDTWPSNMITLPTAPKATCVIDGVKDDGYGDGYVIDKIRDGGNNTTGATGTLYTAWDDNNIYYYIEIKDTTPNHEAANVYERDCVEFFINWNSTPDSDTTDSTHPYWQIRIASAPSADDGTQVSGGGNFDSTAYDQIPFKVAPLVAGDTDLKQGYVIECAMPIALAPGATPLKEGGSVVVDFQIADNQQGTNRDTQAFLDPSDPDVDNQWQWPNADRGILPLGAAKPAPTEAATDAAAPAPAVDVAAPAPAPAAPVTTSAQTGDNTLAIAGIMVLAAAGAVIFRRKLFVK
ncbi:MAG: LPXTG cell wall anchor domain-containing protein [Oscillospiraceae bacterium]|nr:LPXTG cell wall anchor domain-containing protein [Oscillospiraceae bacterium]